MIESLLKHFSELSDRGSFDRREGHGLLHLVSAWASERGLSLGQQSVEAKSNEITAIPLLLESLNIENTLVTLDAMGCQTKIAAQILERKADYLLVLKAIIATIMRLFKRISAME